ncbi:MAG: O-antigen ligase family protein [Verrucomicrobia bacterium]|nr:O-antigen ligase family protein [Verrucomicrobiota bacterium]
MEGTYFFGEHLRWNLGWNNPNQGGAFVAMLIPWLWACAYWTTCRFNRSYFTSVLVLAVELVLWFLVCKTYSRGALAALGIAGVIFHLWVLLAHRSGPDRRLMVARLAGIGILLVATGFFSRIDPRFVAGDASAGNRLILWKGGLEMIAAAPWHGWGAGRSGSGFMHWFQPLESKQEYAGMVNSYLHVGVEYGLGVLAGAMTVMLALVVLAFVAEWIGKPSASIAVNTASLALLVRRTGFQPNTVRLGAEIAEEREAAGRMPAPPWPGHPARSLQSPSVNANITVLCFQPVRADSESRLSGDETTGCTPVGQDRRDESPPAKQTVSGSAADGDVPAVRTPACFAAAAGSSLLVFLIANVFSTLWIFKNLWWLPAAAGLVILITVFCAQGMSVAAVYDRRCLSGMSLITGLCAQGWRFIRFAVMPLAASSLLAVILCLILYTSGKTIPSDVAIALSSDRNVVILYMAGKTIPSDVSIALSPDRNVVTCRAVQGHLGEVLVFPERSVLGKDWGKEIRRLAAAPKYRDFEFHSCIEGYSGTEGARSGGASPKFIVACGAQAPKGFAALARFPASRLILVHPLGKPVPPELMAGEVSVILPMLDTGGSGRSWRAVCNKRKWKCLTSPGTGQDVRLVWPDVLDNAFRDKPDDGKR